MKSTVFIGAALLLGVAGFGAGAGAVEPAGPATRPATQPAIPQPTGFGNQSTSVSVINGDKVVDVHQPGRTIHIEENGTGVVMKVTGQIDGKEVTREFKARTPEQLKKDNPDAYALFMQFNGGGINLGSFNGAAAGVPPLPPGAALDDARKLFEKNLLEQLKGANIPEAQLEEIKKHLKDLQNGASGVVPPGVAADDIRKQIEKDLLDQLKGANIPEAQLDEIKKQLKDLQNGAAGVAPQPGAAAKDARKQIEKELQEQLKGADLPDAQKEEIKKLLKELPDGGQ